MQVAAGTVTTAGKVTTTGAVIMAGMVTTVGAVTMAGTAVGDTVVGMFPPYTAGAGFRIIPDLHLG